MEARAGGPCKLGGQPEADMAVLDVDHVRSIAGAAEARGCTAHRADGILDAPVGEDHGDACAGCGRAPTRA